MTNLLRRAYWSGYRVGLMDRSVERATTQYMANVLSDRLAQVSMSTRLQLQTCLRTRATRGDLAPPFHRLIGLDTDALTRAWTAMPILTRSALTEATRSYTPRRSDRLIRTGGSSGEPVGLFVSPEGFRSKRSRLVVSRRAIGWSPGVPMIGIWGSDADIGGSTTLRSRMISRLSGIYLDGGFAAESRRWHALANRIDGMGSEVALYGYSSLLGAFCAELSRQSRVLTNVKTVWNGAEPADDSLREVVRRVTRQDLHNFYGARETGAMAVEIDRTTGLVALGPHILLEVVDEEGKHVDEGESGRVLVSVLTGSGTALLRYDIGDLATAGPRFDLGHSRLRTLEGRTNDIIPLADGSTVTGLFLDHLVKEFPTVVEFQLLVETGSRTARLQCVIRGGLLEDLADLELLIARRLSGYEVSLESVESIGRTRHGKLRHVMVT